MSAHRNVLMLGDALEAVTARQGFHSPAVLPLLRALVADMRRLAAAQTQAEDAGSVAAAHPKPANDGAVVPPEPRPAPAEAEQAPPAPAAEAAAAPASAAPEPTAKDTAGEERAPARQETSLSALERRLDAADQKLATLMRAVSQLVASLQRRRTYGGHPDRRTGPRLSAGSPRLLIDGQSFSVINWSQRGFLVRIRDADRVTRRPFAFHFMLDLPDETIEFQGQARAVRIERERMAAEFIHLDDAARQKMRSIVQRLSGTAGR